MNDKSTINLFEKQTTEAKDKQVTAKAAYELDGGNACPVCKNPMKRMSAAGIPTIVCIEDRVSLPMED